MYKNDPELRTTDDNIELSEDQIFELKQCASDIFEFAKHFYIIGPDGEKPIELKPHQRKILNSFINGKKPNNIVLAYRQSGKTTLLALYGLWYAIFNPNKCVGILANKQAMSEEIFKKIKLAYHHLPLWMQPGLDITCKNNIWTKDRIALANGSRLFAASAISSAICGKTIDLMIVDEFAYLSDDTADNFMKSIFPAQVNRLAAKMIIASSPHGMNHFYMLWQKALNNECSFEPIKITAMDNPEMYNDADWCKTMELKYGTKLVEQEFLCQFLSAEKPILTDEQKAARKRKIIDKINELTKELTEL